MLKKIKRRINAWRKISAEMRLQEERQRQYEQLVGEKLSYPIIRDLINSAVNGVVIKFVMKDGTTVEMRKEVTPLVDPYHSDLF